MKCFQVLFKLAKKKKKHCLLILESACNSLWVQTNRCTNFEALQYYLYTCMSTLILRANAHAKKEGMNIRVCGKVPCDIWITCMLCT